MPTADYAFAIETKAESDGLATFAGIATTDDMDYVGDVIEAGAFGQINPAKVALLRDHDGRMIIGGWKSFVQDGKRLVAEGVITTKTAVGAETYHLMKEGFLSGLSVGYRIKPGGATYDEKSGTRRVTKASLLETSVVSVPCNDKARIRSVKSGLDAPSTVQWLRDNGFEEDEIPVLMEKGFHALLASKALPPDPPVPDLTPLLTEARLLVASFMRR